MPPSSLDLSSVPVFPLPEVVLLPTAVLPLHVFEDRYRAMTRAALDGDRLIAMALLGPGWQQTYHAKPAIESVVCVGVILSHEELPDGKFNFLLQGRVRAKVVRELQTDEPFRRLHLAAIPLIAAPEQTLLGARQKFAQIFETGHLAGTQVGKTFAKLLNSSMTTAEIADLVAFNCIADVKMKQSLLAEGDVNKRVTIVADLLWESRKPTIWPPNESYKNPGRN
jgi:Lon protease-like protein